MVAVVADTVRAISLCAMYDVIAALTHAPENTHTHFYKYFGSLHETIVNLCNFLIFW